MPASSNLPQCSPTMPAISVVQFLSIAAFCLSDIALYLSLLITNMNVVVYSGASIWYFVTLSMPNSTREPQGKVTASATPRSMMSRTSGAEDCTLVPPSWVTKLAMVASAGRIFMPLMSSGTMTFLVLLCNDDGVWTKARQYLTSFISFSAYLRYQASSPSEPPLASEIRNGSS